MPQPAGILLAAVFAVLALIAPSHAASSSQPAAHSHPASTFVDRIDEPAGHSGDGIREAHAVGTAAEATDPHFDTAEETRCGPAPTYAATAQGGHAQIPNSESRLVEVRARCVGQAVGPVHHAVEAPRPVAGIERLVRDCICRR
ncbi:MAG: hypothetical protein ACT4QF_02790 [Sporichthyaceae bacterium]